MNHTDTPCCEWEGRKNAKGYGVVLIGGKQLFAHRLAVALSGRNIPKGKVCDHLCRNHSCINPEHIELVDTRTNVLRGKGISARRAVANACENNHPFDGENTYFRKDKFGKRQCRKCNADRQRRYRKQKQL